MDMGGAGFQTTYEELKLPTRSPRVGLLWRFQTTYEELKQWPGGIECINNRRFQTTYEELKLRKEIGDIEREKKFSDYL